MSSIAIIGGTGLTKINSLNIVRHDTVDTPYGAPSSALSFGEVSGQGVVFLARHGKNHTIPPHKVNYRANIWALHQAGVSNVIAVNAVGGITSQHQAATLSIPDQIIDYTYSRKHTFFEDDLSKVTHIDFTEPYCNNFRQLILSKAKKHNITIFESATYGATQGPRLESIAEIKKLERDGCDIVGMTGMPEAALARELGLNYACIAVVANLAAGKGDSNITMEIIEENLIEAMDVVKKLLEAVISEF
ncbi:S-methyl-5'-thioinosine phosphorylase [hydrothermal vent metagenome]|uniref:S-methyl-5'-thioinosine phosphorylase n=1 Tax=hydrothermal vent metagenome TaxID=652676 RepID=A0A3B1A0C5_9ZZZZ